MAYLHNEQQHHSIGINPAPQMQPGMVAGSIPVMLEPVNPALAMANQKLDMERQARFEVGKSASKWRRAVAKTVGIASIFSGLFALSFMGGVCDTTGVIPDDAQRECQVLNWAWSASLIAVVTCICITLLAIPAMTRHSALDRLHGFFTAIAVICFATAGVLLTVWMHSRYPVSDQAAIFTYVLVGVILFATAIIYAVTIAVNFTHRHEFAYHPAGEPLPAWFADAKLREKQMKANKHAHNNNHNNAHNNQAVHH